MLRTLRRGLSALLLLVGVAVFAIRLQQPGDYAWPEGGNLLAGLLSLGLGAWGIRDELGSGWLARLGQGAVLLAGPVVLFFGLYATLAEVEEVVVLHATDRDGRARALRLWVVDEGDVPWVVMPASKADAHGLDGESLRFDRRGTSRCVIPTRFTEPEVVGRIWKQRTERYLVQRLAIAVGIFEADPKGGEGVVLRLDPCPLEVLPPPPLP